MLANNFGSFLYLGTNFGSVVWHGDWLVFYGIDAFDLIGFIIIFSVRVRYFRMSKADYGVAGWLIVSYIFIFGLFYSCGPCWLTSSSVTFRIYYSAFIIKAGWELDAAKSMTVWVFAQAFNLAEV